MAGEFRPYQVADLHAKVAGYLRTISVDVGSYVKAGETIATLEVPEMEAELAQSSAERERTEAELGRAHAEVERAKANIELIDVGLRRLTAAAKTEPGIIAQQEIDEAKAKKSAAEAQLAAMKAAVEVDHRRIASAKAAEHRTRAMSSYLKITPAFDGVVVKRFADPGAMIQAGTGSHTQAMPVVRVAQISRLRLVVAVPESAVPLIKTGDRVEVRVASIKNPMHATVARLTRDVSTASRTMEAEIDISNGSGTLTPGMYAEVVLQLEKRERSLTVPVTAVANSGGNRTVMLVSGGSIEEREIKTGIESAASFEVLTGLTDSDDVVVSNRGLLRAGMKVQARSAGE